MNRTPSWATLVAKARSHRDTWPDRLLKKINRAGPTQPGKVSGRCWLWVGSRTTAGYGNVCLTTGRWEYAHRLMAMLAFDAVLGRGLCVLHRCDNPACVRPSHLFLGTRADNNADCIAKGRNVPAHGERGGLAKLTNSQVTDARRRLTSGESQSAIARSLGVSPSTIHNIAHAHTWKHLEAQ